MHPPLLTVAICTWNRARLLDQTLASLSSLDLPRGLNWEVLIVNNNSTDETECVIQRHAARLPLRLVGEARQGKSFALNTAVAAARGAMIVWTDDDVLVDRDWLRAYFELANNEPGCAFAGGPIEPVFEAAPPAWVCQAWDEVKTMFAACNYGNEPLDLRRGRLAFGANFAVRTDVQRRFHYDPRLGRVGAGQVRGEETEVQLRMLAAGLRGRWVPSARVRHIVGAERIELDFVREFFLGIGRSEAVWKDDAAQHALSRGLRRLGISGRLITNGVKYAIARRFMDSAQAVRYLAKMSYLRGRLVRPRRAVLEAA